MPQIGAALFQRYSSGLSGCEKRWSATDKELFAIVSASRKWPTFCAQGVNFHTDHKPLTEG